MQLSISHALPLKKEPPKNTCMTYSHFVTVFWNILHLKYITLN